MNPNGYQNQYTGKNKNSHDMTIWQYLRRNKINVVPSWQLNTWFPIQQNSSTHTINFNQT